MSSGEDKLIARFFKPLATPAGALGLADDAAFFDPPEGQDLVLTTDAIVSGVHFLADDPPGDIARKALRVNLSDLAAKGARPAGCLMTIALPVAIEDAWLQDFADGLKADCESYGCPLFGGDTVAGPLSISIFAFGTLPRGSMVKRAGARPGDRVFASGTIGDAALGLRLARTRDLAQAWSLSAAEADALIGRYRAPQPRVALADAVRACASAAIDVSDGLAGDLAKLCAVSGVSAEVRAAAIPLSFGARTALAAEPDLIKPIATGGDDYEILAAIPPQRVAAFRDGAREAGVAVTEIGEIVKGNAPPRIVAADGTPLTFARASYSHF